MSSKQGNNKRCKQMPYHMSLMTGICCIFRRPSALLVNFSCLVLSVLLLLLLVSVLQCTVTKITLSLCNWTFVQPTVSLVQPTVSLEKEAVGPGHPPFFLLPIYFVIFCFFPFFHWLYLFSSFVHPFPFYLNSPTSFSGRRS